LFWVCNSEHAIINGRLGCKPYTSKEEGKKGKPKSIKTGNLVEQLKEPQDEILRFFTSREKIPFTNNQAERAVRMMKVQQKI